ncbi:ATP-binding protein [Hymenobacter sp. 5516J-16]|uniref:AAA family ATPase n=1 Tax=Hymenobacter sp. 5516J-16 TaxID=2932253 RepID=UPI001FD37051|nr:AAA family ATPase [Hymenobacter sp. 5516J-16]UOQ79109.1 ATP-binding protein [Hymenobacter sp. 5516J-16]
MYKESLFNFESKKIAQDMFNKYSLSNYFKMESSITISTNPGRKKTIYKNLSVKSESIHDNYIHDLSQIYDPEKMNKAIESLQRITPEDFKSMIDKIYKALNNEYASVYIPAERIFSSAIEYSWPGMLRDDIGLPKPLLNFANNFSNARKSVNKLDIGIFKIKYIHDNGHDYIKIPKNKKLFRLYEVASGIQSIIPLMVLTEYLLNQENQVISFIIEEPELNLYPTAQQGLLNWLVEKCTAGENDLTITTHSPYILSHLNLLLYAYQVAEKHPERADEVAQIVPRESWINPKEFACYQVENGGVESLVNEELGLIDDNGLDNLSGDAADAFDNLIRLSKSVTLK